MKSIPNITRALEQGASAHKQQTDVGETDLGTLMKSVENLARGGREGPATGKQTFDTLMEQFRTGAIGEEQGIALLRTMAGNRAMAAGGAGTSPENIFGAAQQGFFRPEVVQGRAAQYQRIPGLGAQTKEDEQTTRAAETERTHTAEEFGRAELNFNSKFLAPLSGVMNRAASRGLETILQAPEIIAGKTPEYTRGAPGIGDILKGIGTGALAGGTAGAVAGLPFAGVGAIPGAIAGAIGGGVMGGIYGLGQAPGPPLAPGAKPEEAAATGGGVGGALAAVASGITAGGAAVLSALADLATALAGGTPSGGAGLGTPSGGGFPDNYQPAKWRGGSIPGFDAGGYVDRPIPVTKSGEMPQHRRSSTDAKAIQPTCLFAQGLMG